MLRQALRLACAVVLLSSIIVMPGAAQTFDRRTLFTFTGPVAMPGVTLPAGQYLFRIADPDTSAKVVQVLSADGSKPYGLFFSYPADRSEPSDKPEVRFMETARGMPAAIKTWWYPGERRGYEFIYPKDQATKLAKSAEQPVLTTHTATMTTEQTNTSELARISATGEETSLSANTAPVTSVPSGATQEGTVASNAIRIPEVKIPAAVNTSQTATAAQPVAKRARTRLPETASPLPIIALISVLAVAWALGLRAWRLGWIPFLRR